MNQRIQKFLATTVTLLLTVGVGWLLFWLISTFFSYVSAVPKEVGAALIAGGATVIVATLTVVIGRYFERKKELDTLHRDRKTQIYDEFLKTFFDHFFSEASEQPTPAPADLVPFFRDFMRKLLLWSGPEPIVAFVRWKEHLAKGSADAQSIFLTEEFLLAIRKDLRHDNRGLPKGFFAKLFLQEGNLFLALAEKNPNVTLAQLAEVEAMLKAGSEGTNG